MKHLVCFVWPSTEGNHAGMAHMCDLLQEYNKADVRVFKIYPYPSSYHLKNKLINRLVRIAKRKLHGLSYNLRYYMFIKRIRPNDDVFLLEYLMPECNQRDIAQTIRALPFNVKIIGLAHLTPKGLEFYFTKDQILEWSTYLDYIMTLGSSLSNYLEDAGIEVNKIKTGFHYVDHRYYYPKIKKHIYEKLRVVVVGNLQRNFRLLYQIVDEVKCVQFVIFSGGNKTVLNEFSCFDHVTLKGYVSEQEMKTEMEAADISLNVMEDTVGSNVITTSMAMGLAIVVSNVGSIKDYCNEESAFFCSNKIEFVDAIIKLNNDRSLIDKMKRKSLEQSQRLHIDKFYSFIDSI